MKKTSNNLHLYEEFQKPAARTLSFLSEALSGNDWDESRPGALQKDFQKHFVLVVAVVVLVVVLAVVLAEYIFHDCFQNSREKWIEVK